MGLDLRNKFDFAGNGVIGTATKNTATDIDFKITETNGAFLNGGKLLLQDHIWGDWFEIQVIDIDGVIYTAGTIVKNYIKKWYVHPNIDSLEIHAEYAGQVPKDLYLRCKYHSTSTTTDVKVAINYRLHISES